MRLIISTAPEAAAPDLAKAIVENRLAACVNIVPKVRSIYFWEGEVQDDAESLMFIKTTDEGSAPLVKEIRKLHPYDVPEIICLDINENESHHPYLKWIGDTVR